MRSGSFIGQKFDGPGRHCRPRRIRSIGGLMSQALSAKPISLAELRSLVSGRVIGPDDAEYDAARATFAPSDQHPAAIVRANSVDDVIRVVRIARETGVELAVRSGGHSGAAHGSTEGGIQLDLSGLKGIEIDVANKTAWAETGLTAGEVTTAVGEHGLVIGFGDTATVGIGGITTGGGIGFLVRKFGLTIDNVLAAAEQAPEELSTICNVMPCPPMPFVPAEHHGKLVIMGMLTYAGDAEAGQKA